MDFLMSLVVLVFITWVAIRFLGPVVRMGCGCALIIMAIVLIAALLSSLFSLPIFP